MHYWNAADGGFYQCEFHGPRWLQIVDPEFEWPMIEVPDLAWEGDSEEAPLVKVRDENIEPPIIEVSNPETKIPPDAVEITAEHYQQLLEGLSKGKRLQADESGQPVLVEPPQETLEALAKRKRRELDRARDDAFAVGLEYQFDGETDIVQTRPQDQINLLGLQAQAQRLIATGQPDAVLTFRGLQNVNRGLTAEEVDTLTLAALGHIEEIYQKSWQLKDQLDSAHKSEDRETIKDISW